MSRLSLIAATVSVLLVACDNTSRPGSVPGRNPASRADASVIPDVGFFDGSFGWDAGSNPNGDGGTQPPGDTGVSGDDCPGMSTNVCRLKTSPPAVGTTVRFERVLVTSPPIVLSRDMGTPTLAGFYVQDTSTSSSLDWRWSGMLVIYDPQVTTTLPTLGDIISVDGTFDTFGLTGFVPAKQVRMTAFAAGGSGTVNRVDIADHRTIVAGGTDADAYEGVPVRIMSAEVTATTVMVNGYEVFGAFEVNNVLPVSGAIHEYSSAFVGQRFTSIAGILRLGTAQFEAGTNFLVPTSGADLVPLDRPPTTGTIRSIQDTSDPAYPTETCANDGAGTQGTCADVSFTRVLVTAMDAEISRTLRGMWVSDPNERSGQYGSVRVVYNPANLTYVPEVGHFVDISGEHIEFFGGTQVQNPTITRNGNDSMTPTPIVVPNASTLAQTSDGQNPFEGALVQIANVVVTEACVEDTRGRDHGDFVVSGNVIVSGLFTYAYNGDDRDPMIMCFDGNNDPTGACGCNAGGPGVTARAFDQRRASDQFTTITGVVDYAFGLLRVQPRDDNALVRL